MKTAGFGGPGEFNAPLTPIKTVRGFAVHDAESRIRPHNTLVSTRTVALPAGVLHLPAVQITSGTQVGFKVVNWPNAPQPSPFLLKTMGFINGHSLNVHRSEAFFGYGAANVTTGTEVLRSQFAPKP